ncbi:MAG: MTH938/NDUFAF3 family protein [Candidatus Micrarchaeia archaeon]
MTHFDKTWFGAVMVDGRTYRDILVIGGKVIERELFRPGWFDDHSHHTVYDHELKELLMGNPEVIIIGSGQSGVLQVPDEVKRVIEKKGIELIVVETQRAIEEYNKLSKAKRVNALIHTTC